MARLVVKTDKGPKEVGGKWICMCGLSKTQPFCDKSHKKTLDEGDETYLYSEEGRKTVTEITVDGSCCCCGHDGKCDECIEK